MGHYTIIEACLQKMIIILHLNMTSKRQRRKAMNELDRKSATENAESIILFLYSYGRLG